MKTTLTALAAAAAFVTASTAFAQNTTTPAGAASGVGSPTIGTNLTTPEKKAEGVAKKDATMAGDKTRLEVKSNAATGTEKMGAGQTGPAGKPQNAGGAAMAPTGSGMPQKVTSPGAAASGVGSPTIGTNLTAPEKKAEGVMPKASDPVRR